MIKKLGQHFLKNEAVAKKIIDAIAPENGDTIIEVGPGHGELTRELLGYPVHIIAIEKDSALVDFLEKKFQITNSPPKEDSPLEDKLQTNSKIRKNNLPRFEIIHGDVLKVLPKLIESGKLPSGGGNYKLVGNIPYYLTGFLFRTISELPLLPTRTVFMVQKEVALRAVATPPRMNLLAASIQLWADPKILMTVGKNDFSPKPKVDSAVIRLETRRDVKTRSKKSDHTQKRRYFDALHVLFKQPRKTIVNNITLGFRSWEKRNNTKGGWGSANKPEGKFLEEHLGRIGVRPKDRPQNLRIEDIKKISEMLYNYSE